METLQETARAITSKPVQRAVVNTALLVSTAVTLFCFAGIASALFFQNFVPDQVVSTPLHLQYGSGLNPYGVASLTSPPMKSQQEYDISVTLSMPRSPANIERGNFMISLHLLDSVPDQYLESKARRFADARENFGDDVVLFSSRRPVLLPYVDPVVSLASRVLFLLYHIFVPDSSTCTLRVPLAEHVSFTKDSVVPSAAYVEVEAGQTLQVYNASLVLTAQLRGLRWLMFHYRLPTYFAFTFLFWICEITFMGIAWAIWTYFLTSSPADYEGQSVEGKIGGAIKDQGEEGQDSDIPQTFPSYGKQPPLKYEPSIKREGEEERLMSELPLGGADADDEDEDSSDGRHRDSGIGTSYSEEGKSNIRRRSSRNVLE